MKSLKVLIMLLLCLNFAVLAQENILKQKVSIDYKGQNLQHILKDINSRYGVNFSYVNNTLTLEQEVNVRLENTTLEDALEQILMETDLEFKLVNGQVILKKSLDKKPRKIVMPREEKADKQSSMKAVEGPVASDLPDTVEVTVKKETATIDSASLASTVEGTTSVSTKSEKLAEPSRPVAPKEQEKEKRTFSLDFLKRKKKAEKALKTKDDEEVKPLHIGLVYPISNHFTKAGDYNNRLAFHGLVGVAKGVRGFEFAGVGNIDKEMVKGGQFAGVFNLINHLDGIQFAGVTNIVKGKANGAQFAGLLNISSDSAYSASFAGFGNFNSSVVKGVQMAGFINTADTIKGFQGAGFINTAHEVEGTQAAGMINIAKNVKGVQLGIINVADTVDGVSIGIFNFVKNGYRRFEVYGGETFHGNVAFKFGTQHFYSIMAGGVHIRDQQDYVWAYGFGFGSQLNLNQSWKLSLDATAYQIKEDGTWSIHDLNIINNLRVSFDRTFSKHFTLFFGPSFNVMVSEIYNVEDFSIGQDMPPYTIYDETRSGTNVKMWPGFFIGIRI